ncbi:Gfo/Idh/MocA family oxidoreductase [Chloroflexota bacterium]
MGYRRVGRGRLPLELVLSEGKGRGALQATAPHYIDAFRWWFGEMTEVCGQLDTIIRERRPADSDEMRVVDTEDAYAFMVRFQNGALGAVIMNYIAWQGRYAGHRQRPSAPGRQKGSRPT